jgi:hypothetical protein
LINTKKELSIPCQPSTGPWNSAEIYKKELEWLVYLAKKKGWKEYVWGEVKRLDADPSGLWTGIKDDLVKEMKNGL